VISGIKIALAKTDGVTLLQFDWRKHQINSWVVLFYVLLHRLKFAKLALMFAEKISSTMHGGDIFLKYAKADGYLLKREISIKKKGFHEYYNSAEYDELISYHLCRKDSCLSKKYLSLTENNSPFLVRNPTKPAQRFVVIGPTVKESELIEIGCLESEVQVFLKPFQFRNYNYSNARLYLSGVYYDHVKKEGAIKSIAENYKEIFVNSTFIESDCDNVTCASKSIYSYCAGPMALQRVLSDILYNYGKGVEIRIYGFNLYLGREIYSNGYPSLGRNRRGKLKENLYLKGLIMHDAKYNFILLKRIISEFNVIDSEDFIKYVDLSVDCYLKLLDKRWGLGICL